ncbi:Ig-like domain-containing protein [Streptomyces sp. NBC_00435]
MRKANTTAVAIPLLTLLALSATACGAGGGGTEAAKPAAEVRLLPADGAKDVKPDEPVTARGNNGTLTAVTVTGPDGKQAEGALKGGAFTPKDGLSVDTEYKVRATATSEDGKETSSESSFRTLKPSKERTETVTGRDRVDWRPREYWKPGTKVTWEAALSGVDTGTGRYLAKSYSTSATIGRSQIARVDIANHRLTLERDGQVVKSVPVTAGDPASTPTWNGRMTLMGKEGTIRMKAGSVGLTGYDQQVQKSMKLTVSGTYAHQAKWAESYGELHRLGEQEPRLHRHEDGGRRVVLRPGTGRRRVRRDGRQGNGGRRQRLRRVEPVVGGLDDEVGTE